MIGFITRETATLQSTHPTQNVKLIIRHYLKLLREQWRTKFRPTKISFQLD